MKHTSDLKKRLLTYLKRRHTGQDNATSSRALEARFSVCGSTVRRTVLCLRRDGEPICSDRFGYYYATSGDELWNTIGRFERRVVGSVRVIQGLKTAASSMPISGQMRLQ